MKIKKLSDSAINRIAAGEVVERPSSVIKELVENSIDAGASNILVRLELAGKNLILIMDDGCGMSKDEILLAVQRHTTSKLNEDDISNIIFFGFRGEALPSIASVSNLKIQSRVRNQETADNTTSNNSGYIVSLSGGEVLEIKEAEIPYGTKIEVRDLFFSTPARLKFLKSDKTEIASCLDIIKRISVSFPHISFTFISDDKELYKVKATENILGRVSDAFGKEFISNSSSLGFEREGYKITGYTSIPTYNKSNSNDQFLYVNKRPVKDKLLNIALRIAYQDYISKDRHPVAVIFIESNPRYVDVNVHPAKTEIRFREASEIRGMLISSKLVIIVVQLCPIKFFRLLAFLMMLGVQGKAHLLALKVT
jgi:DNA mismatch repair protein MutL